MSRRTLAQQYRDARDVLKAGGPNAVRRELTLRYEAHMQAASYRADYNHLLDTGDMNHARQYVADARKSRDLDADGYPVGWPASWKADLRRGVPSKDALRAAVEAKYR